MDDIKTLKRLRDDLKEELELRTELERLSADYRKQAVPILRRLIEIEADQRRQAHDGTSQTPIDMGRASTSGRNH